jgi:transposase-like protein
LTIKADELSGDYCPECYEIHGEKRNDFEKITAKEMGKARYRCEKCGIMTNSE